MRNVAFRWLAVAFIALCTVLAPTMGSLALAESATPTASSEAPLFSISPVDAFKNGFIEYELKPGESANFAARIGVGGTAEAALKVFIGNTLNPVNGGFAVLAFDAPRTGAATWFALDSETIDIAAGSQKDVQATVQVPKDAKPGQYIVGLVAQTAEPIGQSTNGFGMQQIIRSAIAVQITVPGKVKAGFTVGAPTMALENGTPSVSAPIENTGNVLVKPAGTLTVSDATGKKLVDAPITMGSVYMGNSSSIKVVLPGQFAPGAYLVSLSLKDEATGKKASVSNLPATLAAADAVEQTFKFGVSVKANGTPVRYADVSADIVNTGPAIATARVALHVYRDGKEVEVYALADKQAVAQGDTKVSQRYIPADVWKTGTYTFAIEIIVIDPQTGSETSIGVVPSSDSIQVK